MSPVRDRVAAVDAPILDVFAERWSTRVFDPAVPVDEDALASALEAARWAPSASNTQPWRFIVARRGSDAHRAVMASLMGFNREWAGDAAVLVVVLAETADAEGRPLRWAAYDAGQAAASFVVQTHAEGLYAHQMGGFDRDAVSAAFALDEGVAPQTVIAVGALGDPEAVSERLRERERAPRTRRPISESLLVDD